MNSDLKKGIFYSVSSALVFGITPVLASLTFQLGSNALTLTFYRNGMAVPVLLIILLIRKVDLRIKPKELLALTVISVVFSATTTFLVYAAYPYIGVGLATTLHFLYPVPARFAGVPQAADCPYRRRIRLYLRRAYALSVGRERWVHARRPRRRAGACVALGRLVAHSRRHDHRLFRRCGRACGACPE